MKKMTRVAGIAVAATFALALTACGGGNTGGGSTPGDTTSPGASGGSVYFLNFKPEVADVYTQIAASYKAATGVDVKVVTAASGTYAQTLTSEMAKSQPPTIFEINGPVGYAQWKDYTADLTNSWLYQHLTDKSMAISENGGVFGVPYVVEGYGIIYNKAIMDKYFALSDNASGITSLDQINNFDTLSKVVDDMTAKKAELGIQGVFSDTSLKPGEDWRWQTHLANVPFYYEFKNNNIDLTQGTPPTVTFQYGDNFKQLFDLYLNNSTTPATQLGSKTVDDSMAEFALGQSAMVQNGDWAWSQISGATGNTVQASDVGFLPLYIGMPGEETQGICIGTENYFAVNSKAAPADQQASLDFLQWLFSDPAGMNYVTNQLSFIAPFDTFGVANGPSDPLGQAVETWMANTKVQNVPWTPFTLFPSQNWKNDFGADLLSYAQGQMPWSQVASDVVDNWKTEAAAAAG